MDLTQKIKEFRQLQLERYRKRKGFNEMATAMTFKIPDSLKIHSLQVAVGVNVTNYLSSEDSIKIVLEKTQSDNYCLDIRREKHDSIASIKIKKNVRGSHVIATSPPTIFPISPDELSVKFEIWCYKLDICTIYYFDGCCSSDDRGAFQIFHNQLNQIVAGVYEDMSDSDSELGNNDNVSE